MIIQKLQEENKEALDLIAKIADLKERDLTKDNMMRINHLIDDLSIVRMRINGLKRLIEKQIHETDNVLKLADSCKRL